MSDLEMVRSWGLSSAATEVAIRSREVFDVDAATMQAAGG